MSAAALLSGHALAEGTFYKNKRETKPAVPPASLPGASTPVRGAAPAVPAVAVAPVPPTPQPPGPTPPAAAPAPTTAMSQPPAPPPSGTSPATVPAAPQPPAPTPRAAAPATVTAIPQSPPSPPVAPPPAAQRPVTQPPVPAPAPTTARAAAEHTGTVDEIVSTDTLVVAGRRVRLAGVDGVAGQATTGLSQWLRANGNQVTCTPLGSRFRCLTSNGKDVAQVVLLNGVGKVSGDVPQVYMQAEAQARAGGKGLWRQGQ